MHRTRYAPLAIAFALLISACGSSGSDAAEELGLTDASDVATDVVVADAAIDLIRDAVGSPDVSADMDDFDAVDSADGQRDLGDLDADEARDVHTDLNDVAADIDATDSEVMDIAQDMADVDGADSGVEDSDTTTCGCDDDLFCNGPEGCSEDGRCTAGVLPRPVDDADPCTIPVCSEELDDFVVELDVTRPECGFVNDSPRVDGLDYAFMNWPRNHRPTETWPVPDRVQHFVTGHYALAYDELAGDIVHVGSLTDGLSYEEAASRENSDIDALAGAELRLEAGTDTETFVANSFLGEERDETHRTRLLEGGRFMNHVIVPTVGYADASYAGGDGHRVDAAALRDLPPRIVVELVGWGHRLRTGVPGRRVH